MEQVNVGAMLAAFFLSWQFKTIAGLILADFGLGVAKALRVGDFEWTKLAAFYRSNVMPYVLGYMVLYGAVQFVIPAEAMDGLGETINQATVTLAWGALVGTLLASIGDNIKILYQGSSEAE